MKGRIIYFDDSTQNVLIEPIFSYYDFVIEIIKIKKKEMKKLGRLCDTEKIEKYECLKNNIDHIVASTYIYIVHLLEQSIRSLLYDEKILIVPLSEIPDNLCKLNNVLDCFDIGLDEEKIKEYSDYRNILKHREGKTKNKYEEEKKRESFKSGHIYTDETPFKEDLFQRLKELKEYLSKYFKNIPRINKLNKNKWDKWNKNNKNNTT